MAEPLPDLAISEAKLVRYLLDPAHPVGGPKAVFFLGQGFTVADASALALALIDHATGATVSWIQTQHGRKFIFEGPLDTPSGKTPRIRSVWVQGSAGAAASLVTAYPI